MKRFNFKKEDAFTKGGPKGNPVGHEKQNLEWFTNINRTRTFASDAEYCQA